MDKLEADIIIVGAGSAGCVLANRLTEDPATRVILIEAGSWDNSPWIRLPIGYGKTYTDDRFNWCCTTAPVPGLNNRTSYWPRGKVIGGSSSINAMVYVRGQAADYDDWAQAGNMGWGWLDVAPFFRKMEQCVDFGSGNRGHDGPLKISNPTAQMHPLTRQFVEAAQAAGLPYNDDYNDASQHGVSTYQQTNHGGQRCSAATAYLHPIKKRPNLRVLTKAAARRTLGIAV